MLSVMVSMMLETCSIFSTSCSLEDSTSFMAPSMVLICCPSCTESSAILFTLSPVFCTFSSVSCMSFMVSSMEAVICSEIPSSLRSASLISPEESFVSVLRVLICSATTEKPFPASPALAASIDAFSARRLVWLEILSIFPVSCFTVANSVLKSERICSTSEDNWAIVPAVLTSPARSAALTSECFPDSAVRLTISSIMEATF